MNDNHLDPPDYPDPPEWYSAIEQVIEEEQVPDDVAQKIRDVMETWSQSYIEYDPGPEPVIELPDDFFYGPEQCPHGKKWGECDACDHASDLAFDAARESRFSR